MTLPPLAITRRFLGDRTPSWVAALGGAALVVLGWTLMTRPFSALTVLAWYLGASCLLSGLAELTVQRDDGPRSRMVGWATAVGWVVLGVLVVGWASRSVGTLVPVIAGALVLSGALAVVRAVRQRTSEHLWRAAVGIAEIVFGLLAGLWPDATLFIAALLFGARTALVGLALLAGALAARFRLAQRTPGPPATRRRWIGATLVLLLAAGAGLASYELRNGPVHLDSFYAAPDEIPQEPGALVRWDGYDGDVPDGMNAYRLLYVTTDASDRPVLASAVLSVPVDAASPPLVTWAHGTVGVARGCAPSLTADAVSSATLPASDAFVRNGWAVVATDYPGMGTAGAFPYLIGEGQGRAVLDAARAARSLPTVRLGDETVVWGHSQGGHAARWAGQIADAYAPELDVAGTAALSPASDPLALAEGVLADPGSPGASLAVSFVVDAYTQYYPELDVDDVVVPSARTVVREAAGRCTSDGATLVTLATGLAFGKNQPIVAEGALDGPFGARLAENVAVGPWSAPLFVAHGDADTVVPARLSDDLASRACAAGEQIELLRIPGGGHLDVLADGSPLSERLERWTLERFAGSAPSSTCGADGA